MSKYFKFMTVALSVVLCFATTAFGQGTGGSIEGTITDPNGAAIPNASVRIESIGTTAGFNRTITADASGYINVSEVPPGTYRVTVSGTNFAERSRDITVAVDRATNVSVALQVGGTGAVVDVVADSTVNVDTTNTTIDTNITQQIFESLPTGTTFSSVLKVAPNVRPEPLSGGFQIDGASGSENVFVIDGQEVTNFRDGTLTRNNNVPFELLQEVQIKSTGFNAEYGGATGGVINAVSAGGNNAWRGNFGVSFRPSKLQGDPRPSLNRFATTALGQTEDFQPPKDGGTDFFPVAALSGPIIKDRLWFSGVYAPQIQEITRRIDYFGNSIAGNSSSNPNGRFVSETIEYNQTLKQEQAFARLDAQLYSKLRAFGTFLWNPLVQDGVLPAATSGLTGAPPSANFGGSVGLRRGAEFLGPQGGRQNSNNVNGQITWTPLNYLVLNFRAGRTFLNEKLSSYEIPRVTRFICDAQGAPQSVPNSGCSPGFQSITNNNQVDLDVSTRTTFDADASLVGINLAGRHNFKFGYQYNRLFNEVSRGHTDLGVVVLYYGIGIDALAPITPTAGNLGSGFMQRFGTVGEASSTNQALFAQDSWQIGRRLTLNLGIRIEKELVPNFGPADESDSIEFNWGDKIAPRFGAAFDLTGDGKTKLFASYGWFYDRFKYELPRGSFGGDFFRNDYFEILPSRGAAFSNYTFAAILGGRSDELGGTCPIVPAVGFSRCQFDFRIATNSASGDIFESGGVDPDISAARQSEYTFGVERQLGRNFLLSGRYTHKQVDRAIEDVGVVTPEGSEAYIIGNPGFGLICEITGPANLPCPKAQRDYDAFEVRVDKRSANYFFNASYTLSRLYGNYSGLASSDEAGRNAPNVNRFFDLPPLGFTADGEPDNGRLATDRPHVFKAYGGYSFNWWGNASNRTTVSAFTTVQSGTPLTTIYNLYSLGTTILNGRGDLGRTEMFTETDLSVSHRYKFGRDDRFTLEPFIDIRNLFDEASVLGIQTLISTQNFRAPELRTAGCTTCGTAAQTTGVQEAAVFDTIFNRGGIRSFVNSILTTRGVSPTGLRNDFEEPNSYQAGRDVRFGARFFF